MTEKEEIEALKERIVDLERDIRLIVYGTERASPIPDRVKSSADITDLVAEGIRKYNLVHTVKTND